MGEHGSPIVLPFQEPNGQDVGKKQTASKVHLLLFTLPQAGGGREVSNLELWVGQKH